MAQQKNNIIAQLRGELRAAELKATKAELKKLLEEYAKAKKVLEGIFEAIVKKAEEAEMTPEEVQKAFSEAPIAVEEKAD